MYGDEHALLYNGSKAYAAWIFVIWNMELTVPLGDNVYWDALTSPGEMQNTQIIV